MTLLAPGALVGLLLLAIPIVVHLFKPRNVRQTPFSSLRWLHLTQQRMARRIQWHQVLLFLLRATFLTLLVMALARPLIVPRGTTGSLDRAIVVDVSRSMGRQVEGRPRPIDSARELAVQTFERMQPGDRTAVLLTAAKTTVLVPWTTDAAPYLASLQSLEPVPTATNLDSSLETLRSLLNQRRADASVEVCFLTDNTSGSWTPGAIASFVAGLPQQGTVSLRLVDVGLPGVRNGWLASARLRETEAGLVLRVEATCAGDAPQPRTVYVAGLVGVQESSSAVTLQPGRPTTLELPLPASFDRSQSHARLRLEPADELPDDDELFVDLDTAGATRVLVVEPEGDDDSSRPGFPLRTALGALAATGAKAADYQISFSVPADVSAERIAAADIVLLVDVPGLTAAQSDSLIRRVREGAGAAVFLGPSVQTEVYNQRFTNRLQPAEGLLPSSLGSVVQVAPARGRLAAWGHFNARHPLLAGLLDPLIGDLALTQSRAYLGFIGDIPAADEVLAAFDDGTPILITRQVDAGRVVWFNASADDRWCDLPRRKSFVPLVDRLLAYLSASGSRRSFDCGEEVTLRLPNHVNDESVVVQTPSGKTLEPRVDTTPEGMLLKLDAPMEAGFYRVDSKRTAATPREETERPTGSGNENTALLSFVVQPSRAESAMGAIDTETLRSWWQPANFELLKPTSFDAVLDATESRLALEPWLMILAGLVFLAEMFLVHWLCPRINPALAASSGRRRGFVAPLRIRKGAPE